MYHTLFFLRVWYYHHFGTTLWLMSSQIVIPFLTKRHLFVSNRIVFRNTFIPFVFFMVKITLGTSSYKNNNVLMEVRGKGFYRAK